MKTKKEQQQKLDERYLQESTPFDEEYRLTTLMVSEYECKLIEFKLKRDKLRDKMTRHAIEKVNK